MPDDRMIHRRMLRGDRIAALTDFERGVWLAYQLIADDYGVMRFSAIDLQKAVWLEKKPRKTVQKGFDTVVSVGLIHTFQDGDRTQVYQRDWNTWQNVRHPRATIEPCPPVEALQQCDEKTAALFQLHPRCPTGFLLGSFGKVSVEVPQDSGFTRAGALATAKATGSRLPAKANGGRSFGAGAGSLPIDHRGHLACFPVCMSERIAAKYLPRFNGDEDALQTWAVSVCKDWQERTSRGLRVPEGDDFVFWAARYDEHFKHTAQPAASARTIALAKSDAAFLNGGD